MAEFPHKKFEHINEITIAEDSIFDFCVKQHGIRLECRLNQKIKNDYLIVAPHGAVQRDEYQLPVFGRWNWDGIFKSSILTICDPSLYLDDELPVGWFAGTRYQNSPELIVDTVNKIAKLLNISPSRIIFWGSSAGGYASILLSSLIDGAKFVCANGQTTILAYGANHVELYRRVFDTNSTALDLAKYYPERWSAIDALQSSYDKKRKTSGIIIQNTIDKRHYEKHYKPFCEHFSLSPEGSSNDSLGLHSMLYTHEGGHGPEPAQVAKEIIKNHLPKLLNDL